MRATGRRPDPAVFLLPLRGFLGVTYVYAAFQKFHDPAFLDPSAPGSFAAQTAAFRHSSPVGFALGPAHAHPLLFGLIIAFGELAVGLGTLLGLWTRVAAAGGVLLALTFFLTVSWNTDPYYLGSDLGFAVAFLTLALAGPVRWSLDSWLASAKTEPAGESAPVVETAPAGESAPDLAATLDLSSFDGDPAPESGNADPRRLVLKRAAATGITGGAALLGAAGAGTLGRSGRGKQNPQARSSANSPVITTPAAPNSAGPNSAGPNSAGPNSAAPAAPGLEIAVTAIPATGAARLTAPGGDPVFVARTADGGYKACSGICTHAGCPVGVDPAKGVLLCPCHGSSFDPKTGAVITGPAQDPLPSFPVTVTGGLLRVQKA